MESRFAELYAAAHEARSRARETVRRSETLHQDIRAASENYRQARARADRLRALWLSGQQAHLRYSAMARLQARLASMPVIEQAKGVLMAQCGWTADEAFDALRKASQRSNLRVRDLAAKIVATTASAPAQPRKHASLRAQEPPAVVPLGRAGTGAAHRPHPGLYRANRG